MRHGHLFFTADETSAESVVRSSSSGHESAFSGPVRSLGQTGGVITRIAHLGSKLVQIVVAELAGLLQVAILDPSGPPQQSS